VQEIINQGAAVCPVCKHEQDMKYIEIGMMLVCQKCNAHFKHGDNKKEVLLDRKLICPYCKKGFLPYSSTSVGTVSEKCSNCGNIYEGDLKTGTVRKVKKQK